MTSLRTEYKWLHKCSRRGASKKACRYVACEREICPIEILVHRVTPSAPRVWLFR